MNSLELTNPGDAAASGDSLLIGNILVNAGCLSSADAGRILHFQKARRKRFGDAAIELGLLKREDIRFALASQFDYSYLPAGDNSLSQELLAAYRPFSPVVEQLRALRSQLVLRRFNSGNRCKALAILSPGIGEGRSFIAANLAIVFAQLGQRTLLIDADLRSPRQHGLFKLDHSGGLSGLLAGRSGADAIVRIHALPRLHLLPAGAVPPNPQELLGRSVFVETLGSLAGDFDVIIIDTPAGGVFADAQTIAAGAGAALMLARRNSSSLGAMAQLVHSLKKSGTGMVGSVLNDA